MISARQPSATTIPRRKLQAGVRTISLLDRFERRTIQCRPAATTCSAHVHLDVDVNVVVVLFLLPILPIARSYRQFPGGVEVARMCDVVQYDIVLY